VRVNSGTLVKKPSIIYDYINMGQII
jgi:hypothetical protein